MDQSSDGSVIQLERDDIRQISTSQVIANLSGACRELIDNALDAKATTIEIRVVEFGSKQLEVIDNGSGVLPSNFNALCKPHSTSKLSSFDDFDTLLTFGFRGEALNALASLSELTMVTHHKSEPTATRLKFNQEGDIIERSAFARPVGTTVTLTNLFSPLPVRRKQFQTNAKEEFGKMLSSVQAFALSRTDVRFVVNNVLGAKTNRMLATQGGNSNLKSTINTLFGAKSDKEAMLEIQNANPDEETLDHFGLSHRDDGVYDSINVSGYVSSCQFGCGRYSPDRQFVFINKRPVDYDKMCKVVNEVYSSFNRGQHCTLVLFIDLDPKCVDPNLTPDKRQVFLKYEKEVFAKLRACLLKTFESVVGACPKANVVQEIQTPAKAERKSIQNENDSPNLPSTSFAIPTSPSVKAGEIQPLSTLLGLNSKVHLQRNVSSTTRKTPAKQKSTEAQNTTIDDYVNKPYQLTQMVASKDGQVQSKVFNYQNSKAVETSKSDNTSNLIQTTDEPAQKRARTIIDDVPSLQIKPDFDEEFLEKPALFDSSVKIDLNSSQSHTNLFDASTDSVEEGHNHDNCHTAIEPSADMLETTQVGDVERKLSLMLKKEDFGRMHVIGQFNNAFILTRLGNNLFVIDQHASDEKYNFERLQQNHKLEYQKLIAPKKMQLGAVYETVISDNSEIFRANGFEFEFYENELPGQRLKLVSIPTVRDYMFDQNDIEEMAAVLQVYPHCMYRPEKIRKIFASWACRSSIMIGKALKEYEMKRVVVNMGKIENPWNCPHGRPTIRHLVELKFPLINPHIFKTADNNNALMEDTKIITDTRTVTQPEFILPARLASRADPVDYGESQIY